MKVQEVATGLAQRQFRRVLFELFFWIHSGKGKLCAGLQEGNLLVDRETESQKRTEIGTRRRVKKEQGKKEERLASGLGLELVEGVEGKDEKKGGQPAVERTNDQTPGVGSTTIPFLNRNRDRIRQ